MRVAIVLHTPKSPQSAVYVGYRHLADDLAARGHVATILAPQDFTTLRRLHARWYALLYPIRVAAWLARHGREYDLVVFHSYGDGDADRHHRSRGRDGRASARGELPDGSQG